MEEEKDELESENQVDGGETIEQETTGTDDQGEDQKDYQQIAEDQRKRAEKAEAEARELREKVKTVAPKPAPVEKQTGLTPLDTIALIDAKVTSKEDIEVVQKYARNESVSIEQALKDPVVKTILAKKAEERRTAEATNTQGSRRGNAKPSDDDVLSAAAKGNVTDDTERLAEARMNRLKK